MRTNWNWLGWIAAGALVVFAGSGLAQSTGTAEEEPAPPPAAAKLDGAEVYAWNCGSCHSERWPKERTDAEWELVVTHMRVRANMTSEQTEAVLSYLQGSN